MLRREFVQRKLQLIAQDLQRLTSFQSATLEEITDDPLKLAAVKRFLERIVTRAIDINQHIISEKSEGKERRATRLTYRLTFEMLANLEVYPREFAERIAKSAGLRNILVHDYNDADHFIVHRSIAECLRDYEQYIRYVDEFVEKQE